MLQHVTATRYVTPLREGGSLPGIVEADDLGTYVVKFRGAGQGSAALVSEIVVGELGRRLGVRVPDLVLIELDAEIGRREPDQEVQELLLASVGLNLGMDFLPGSIGFDGMHWQPPAEEAARIYWLDALTGNVDRTWANPNTLIWHRKLWAIDHGAALVFQHSWPAVPAWAARRYDLSKHVLGGQVGAMPAAELKAMDEQLADAVTPEILTEVLALVPDEFLLKLNSAPADASAAGLRERYAEYLLARRSSDRAWWPESAV
ncbi:aminotransferase class I and II [Actinospica durhamensis]|uniref:Aminotransferase class I and II n=1 Tax=Actinospica durhamensis TaxID=1508375 RepID=A0A941ELN8_9ACTN|nr:HipA family kinase [Actinospica durhamensis]MBR7832638.1 aminotransferase class I and II [Actinospica durhamensis]